MASLIKSVKAFGEKVTGQKINGNTLMGVMKDMGQKMTGKEIKGNSLLDIIDATTKDYTGGGAKVVTELPKVGEEHMVYELQETKVADFPWLLTEFDNSHNYPFPRFTLIVVENEEDVTYDNLSMGSTKANHDIGVYVKATNKVYRCWWEEAEMAEEAGPEDLNYFFEKEEVIPEDNVYHLGKPHFVILKDFDYHYTYPEGESEIDVILDGTGHFLDDTEFAYDDLGYAVAPLVLTNATNKKIVLDTQETLLGVGEAELIPDFVKQVGKIDLSLLGQEIAFVPQPKRTIESYWIYTNSKWVNIDEINTEPALHKTVFGTLTDTGDQTQLQCSLTLKEMADAIAEGNCVVLELYLGDGSRGDYWYCTVTSVSIGGEAPDSATITATWSLMNGYIYWNRNTGAFGFDNGIM